MKKEKYVSKPNEIRMKLLNYCTNICEYSNSCFGIPLSKQCINSKEIKKRYDMK